jgi:hypothetical protein
MVLETQAVWLLDAMPVYRKKTETTPCILSDHNGIKLELNNKGNGRKYFKHLETEQHVAP